MEKNNSSKNNYRYIKAFNSSLVVICIILVLIGKFDLIVFRNISAFLTDFFAPISNVFNKPVKEIENVIEDVQSVATLRKENIRFKNEIRRLKVSEKNIALIESELIELKKLLNFIPQNKRVLITGRVLNISGGTFAKTMLINSGSKDGIKIGLPVVSSLGLVGSIINVGPSSSRVLLLIDINSMIPVFLTQSGWPAIAQGQNGSFLKLRFLSSEASPLIGEIVETSGHGGKFPSGINIGKIVNSKAGKFVVKLSSNPQKLRFVSILELKENFSQKNRSDGLAPLQGSKDLLNLKGFNEIE